MPSLSLNLLRRLRRRRSPRAPPARASPTACVRSPTRRPRGSRAFDVLIFWCFEQTMWPFFFELSRLFDHEFLQYPLPHFLFQFCTFRLFFMIRIFVMVNIYPGPRTHVATIFCTICLPSIKNCLLKDLCSFDGEKRRNWFVIEGNWYLYLIWKNRFFRSKLY